MVSKILNKAEGTDWKIILREYTQHWDLTEYKKVDSKFKVDFKETEPKKMFRTSYRTNALIRLLNDFDNFVKEKKGNLEPQNNDTNIEVPKSNTDIFI